MKICPNENQKIQSYVDNKNVNHRKYNITF